MGVNEREPDAQFPFGSESMPTGEWFQPGFFNSQRYQPHERIIWWVSSHPDLGAFEVTQIVQWLGEAMTLAYEKGKEARDED